MNELYRILGVKKTATHAEIRAAYRKRSLKAHPDRGGSAEAFAKLKRAHDILTDPERRAAYDRDGTIEEKGADNAQALVIAAIAQAFDKAVNKIVSAGRAPKDCDVIDVIRSMLRADVEESRKERAAASGGNGVLQSLRNRFRKAGEPETLFEGLLRSHEAQFSLYLKMLSEREKTLESALALLEDYTFARDIPQMITTMQFAFYASGATTA